MEGIVVAYGWFDGERLVGCAALQVLDGIHYMEFVAVEGSARNRGLGASLVDKIEEEARVRGVGELWAKARLPGFYERLGYEVRPERGHGAKSIDGCEGCAQYGKTCHPAMVVKRL